MSLIAITLARAASACVLSPGFQPGQARCSGLVSGERGGQVAFQASERLVAAFRHYVVETPAGELEQRGVLAGHGPSAR